MSSDMVADALGYSTCIKPLLQRFLCHVVLETSKHFVSWLTFRILIIKTNEFKCFLADRILYKLLSLLHTDSDKHASVTIRLKLVPCECHDVTLAKSCKARKEKGNLQYLKLARCLCKCDKLLL